jgi:hypothetical protein
MNKRLLGFRVGYATLIVMAVFVFSGAFFVKHHFLTRNNENCFSFTDKQSTQSSYCLKSDTKNKSLVSNVPINYSFSIVDNDGNKVKGFAITHTKTMHLIVVRKDLAYFQHLHPEFDETTGIFTLSDLTFPANGSYRIFTDFALEGDTKDQTGTPLAVTLSEDVKVGSSFVSIPLGLEEKNKIFNDMEIALSTTPSQLISGQEELLTFNLMENGKAITDLEEYLGALGHSVILREGTLDFIHAHPVEKTTQNGKVEFIVTFPEAGRYKVFTQFQRDGKIITTEFVVSVAQDSSVPMQPADHSMH